MPNATFLRPYKGRKTTVWPHDKQVTADSEGAAAEAPVFVPSRRRRALHDMPQPTPRTFQKD